MQGWTLGVAASALIFASAHAQDMNVEEPKAQAIDNVWSGQRLWFDFVSQGRFQMVAYYDAARQMSVAVRQMNDINGAPWVYHKLDSFVGWDAHNNVEAAFDEEGYIHIIGNMHANPLVYFRSTEPYDPRTLEKVDIMVKRDDERSMTYPSFFKDPDGRLLFKYRDGTSGQGQWYYNRWDTKKKRWSHLHDTTILDGEGQRGVYPFGPVIGPDGFAHIAFVWRETSRASSNHDLSYARSRDMIVWETSDGVKIDLPITLGTGEIIDPIPQHGGLLNGRTPVGFDANNKTLITYQKYDNDGQTQVFILRREDDGWRQAQVSTWEASRVDLDKSGALDLPIDTSEAAYLDTDNNIVVPASWRGVRWEWTLDADTLAVISGGPVENALPPSIAQYDLENDIPFRVTPMMVEQTTPSDEYYLSWEALQPNRDQARADIPPAATLRVHYLPKAE